MSPRSSLTTNVLPSRIRTRSLMPGFPSVATVAAAAAGTRSTPRARRRGSPHRAASRSWGCPRRRWCRTRPAGRSSRSPPDGDCPLRTLTGRRCGYPGTSVRSRRPGGGRSAHWPPRCARRGRVPARVVLRRTRLWDRSSAYLLRDGHRLPQPRQGLAEQPGDMHLRDTALGGDLGLGHVAGEAKVQDPALPPAYPGQQVRQGQPVRQALQLRVPLADRGTQLAVLRPARCRRVERDRLVRVREVQPLGHLLLVDVEVPREVRHRRRPAQLVRQYPVRLRHLHLQLLQPARYPYRPAQVAEVLLQLAPHGRPGEVGEGPTARVVPVDRLDEPHGRHLDEILERLAPTPVVPGDADRERAPQPGDAGALPAPLPGISGPL